MKIHVQITRQENADYFGQDIGSVVDVDLTEYIAGVVASEIGNAHPEAAKAQAIAARTFAYPYYSKGLTITDASSKHQAYRAPRATNGKYPNAAKAAADTAGQLLAYFGQVLTTCSYSASNGGMTVSSAQRWGGARPWLIAQPDPWDAAAGTGRTGHGVGMSQRGACYAASIGKTCAEILAFYYPSTEIINDTTMKGGATMNEKAQKTVEAARSQLGGPYVFGAWGDECTPSLRKKYSGYNPSHATAIAKKCQVMNGSAGSCAGCKYQGRLAFDCRGFTHWVLMQAGIKIDGSGATSQYNTAANWVQRGTIDQLPDLPCCLFKRGSDGKTMLHTGYHIGGGQIIHCSAGVQTGKTTDKGWTHYAIPAGLYTDDELRAAGLVTLRPTMKKGSKGAAVQQLQHDLKELGYDCGEIDGVFGAMTAAAVRCFQADHKLTIDAIVGVNTWAAIDTAMAALLDQMADQLEQQLMQDMGGGTINTPQEGPVQPQDGPQDQAGQIGQEAQEGQQEGAVLYSVAIVHLTAQQVEQVKAMWPQAVAARE